MKFQRVSLLIVFVALTLGTTLNGQFVPNVVLLDLGGRRMTDPEFDRVGYQVTWQDEDENLWVAPVDRVTGNININGAQLVDTDLAPNAPISSRNATGNGPEWVYTSGGSQICYTLLAGPGGPRSWRIAIARKTATGWEGGRIENGPRGRVGGAPEGTKAGSDSDPLVGYYFTPGPGKRGLAWFHLNNPSSDGIAPFEIKSPFRWADGEHVLVTTVRVRQVDQVILFDPVSGASSQLTSDRDSIKSKPQMWQAPEFGGQRVFFALEQDSRRGEPTQIGVYRVINGSWMKFKTIIPPSDPRLPIIDSPEHFVFKGQSYIVMAMTSGPRSGQGTEIWLAGVGQNFYRKIAGPENGVGSTDPEYLVTQAGVFIYLAQSGGRQVYRADTGLR
jgi:hypothetical protein